MPNLIHTNLTVFGPPEVVAAFRKKAREHPSAGVFSFEAFIPMPQELDVERSSDTQMADLVYNGGDISDILTYGWVKYAGVVDRESLIDFFDMRYGSPGGMREVAAILQANRDKYGVKDWREWRGKYWGTSHDVMDAKLVIALDSSIQYQFDTAWTAPTTALVAISAQYPDLVFSCEFLHERGEFHFVSSWQNGACLGMCSQTPSAASVLPVISANTL